ncbi:MAG TPA: hypothetical protein ENK43_10890, partial [Planctomycetes bacterium]|nr:hypothetical protein [Planctomycetota bacterium]
TQTAGTSATKDTTAPMDPTTAGIAAGANNAINIVNSFNVTTSQVDVAWPAGSDASDTFVITVSDGTSSVSSASANVTPGATTMTSLDLSSLAEGALTVNVATTDANGNPSTFAGTAATKDTTAPMNPTSANVAAGANNVINIVNTFNVTTSQIDVAWPAGSDASDTFTITVGDGSATVTSIVANVTPGATTMTSLDLSSLADGALTVSVSTTDANGNPATFAGTAATKDTVAPVVPTAARIEAGPSNAADIINSASVTAATTRVTWSAGADAADSFTVTLGDGAATVVSSSANPAPGSSSMVALDASSLADGSITITVDMTDAAGNPASFTGIVATKDTVAPTAPTSAGVASGANNAADIINSFNVGAAQIDVVWPAGADAADNAVVQLSDGFTTLSSASQSANPSNTVSYVFDTSALAQGSITVSVVVTDTAGNTTSFGGTSATKDTVAPAAPSLYQVAAGTMNPANTVNSATVSTVNLAVNYAASTVATDMVTLRASDGVNPDFVLGPIAAPAAGGVQVYAGNDLSGLADGSLTLTLEIADAAGNTVSFTGMAATKDTVLAAPTAAAVPSGANNPADTINGANVTATQVDVTMPATADGTEMVTVTLFDGITSVTSTQQTAPSGGGTMSFSGIDASALVDGGVTLTVSVTDAAQNMQSFTGTAITKDTANPVVPTAANVAAGAGNPQDVINISSETSVSVSATFPATADGSETATVTMSDGSASVTSSGVSVPAGGGTVTFSALDLSSLADGSITMTVDMVDTASNTSSFTGTPATKDTTVVAASSATIPAGATNAADAISATNVSAVQVDVTFPATADGTETAILSLTDGAATVTSGSQSIPAGGGVVTFTGLDASGLADGSVTVNLQVDDANMNSVTSAVLTASKDTVAPPQPTVAKVALTANNPESFINIASNSMVTVEMTFPVGSDAADVAVVSLFDGAITVQGQTNAPAGGGTVQVTGIDASSLQEGTITVSVDVTDAAGNPSGTFTGTSAVKDVTAPPAPIVNPVTTPTNLTTQVITGVGPQSTEHVVDGGSAQATATSDTGGNFAITVPLAAGVTNNLVVYARDVAGNPSTMVMTDWNAASLNVLQDATAPDVPFTDDTAAKGLGAVTQGSGGAFADWDNDGDLDLFLCGPTGGMLLDYDGTTGSFSDITSAAGGPLNGSLSAVWGDFDNDGDLDLLTLDATAGTTLYRNDNVGIGTKTLTDVTATEAAGLSGATATQVFWLDFDNDGWLDFYVLDSASNANVIMRNQRGAATPMNSFAAASGTGLENNLSASRFGAVTDFDVDNDIDVVFGDISPGVFYRNNGSSTFTDIAGATSGVSFDHSAGGEPVVFVDYDNDGDFDLFIARGGAAGVNQLWRNDGAGTFTEVAALAGIDTDVQADDVVFGDIDNDGFLDLYIGSSTTNKLYRGLGDTNADNVFEFTEIASMMGVGVDNASDAGMVQMGDIDNDGDLDIFVGNDAAAAVLYRNDLNNFNFLKVKVAGQGSGAGTSSSDARGAVIILKSSDGSTTLASREINGGRGAGSQDHEVAHFGGIVPSTKYRIEVHFPGGSTKTIIVTPRFLAGQTVTVTE